jgi:organic hydroperoxide reductase OsmC/OhrA
VVSYSDAAEGRMNAHAEGGEFVEVVLHPEVRVADESMIPAAVELHARASRACFIAASVNFPVRHQPSVAVA